MNCCETITLNIVQTDQLPKIRIQVADHDTGIPVNLVGVSVTASLRVREYGAAASVFDAPMVKVEGGIYGWVRIDEWPEDAFDLDPGIYEGQLTLTFGDENQTMTRKLKIRIHEKFTAPV